MAPPTIMAISRRDPMTDPTMTPVRPDPWEGAMFPALKVVDWTEVVVRCTEKVECTLPSQ